jgi:hypothetical protein
MSFALMQTVMDMPGIPLAPKAVLLVLARHARDDGFNPKCPSVQTIAEKAGMSDKCARNALRSLEADGWIEALGRKVGGRAMATNYRIIINRLGPDTRNDVPPKPRETRNQVPGNGHDRGNERPRFHAETRNDVPLNPERRSAEYVIEEVSIGGALCETSESPPRVCAPAREGGTQAAPVSAKIITLDDARGPAVPLPAGWLLPDEWRAWAEQAGQRDVETAARRFFDHWFELGAAKTADGWRRAWERWIGQNIKRGFAHGRQRHNGKSNRGNGLTAYVYAEYGGGPGNAEDDPADGRRRLVRG